LGIKTTLVRMIITAGGLAAYETFIKTPLAEYFESTGQPMGFGHHFLFYFLTIFVSYALAWILTRKKGGGSDAVP